MAKNNKKQIEAGPVVKYDQLGEVVANSCLGKRHVGPSGGQLGEVILFFEVTDNIPIKVYF